MTGSASEPGDSGRPRRVLVVDDEQDIRDLVLIWLSDDPRCAAVSGAADLDAAVQVVQAESFDAVLLDFYLGDRACSEVLPDIRRALPDALIIVHTASRRAALDAGVISGGADLVLEKANVDIDDVATALLTTARKETRAS